MKTWDAFFPDVLPKVLGCPDPVAEHAIKRAAQEFFETTRTWRLWLDDVTTVANGMEYDLELAASQELVRLERATLNGRPIRVRTEDELPDDWKTYYTTLEEGVHTSDRQTLILLPPQAADMTLKVEASVKPGEDAAGIENHLFAQYVKQIGDGAIAALKELDGSWRDLVGAQVYRSRFEGHMGVTSIQRYRGFSSARPRRTTQFF